jgi:hypothetical protein
MIESKKSSSLDKEMDKILEDISILVDPFKTPKPICSIHHEELVLLCRKLTGVTQ